MRLPNFFLCAWICSFWKFQEQSTPQLTSYLRSAQTDGSWEDFPPVRCKLGSPWTCSQNNQIYQRYELAAKMLVNRS